jgi:hydroxyacylglutathione hydrolase
VFVGDLGRPDLLESVVGIKESSVVSAGQLFESVIDFLELPDYLQIWPGHGVGSACGKEMGAVPESTVGYEKRLNQSILAISSGKKSFINSILADQGDPPLYFKNMKFINRDIGATQPPEIITTPLNLQELTEMLKDKTVKIIDAREDRSDFMKRHLPGSIYIALNKSFPKSAGSYFRPDDKIVVMVDDYQQFVDVHTTLTRIGIDNIMGFALLEVLDNMQLESDDLSAIKVINFDSLHDEDYRGNCLILDVRYNYLYLDNHIPNAVNIYYTNMANKLADLPRDKTIIVHCTTGNSAAGAASFLSRDGFDVIYVDDEWEHYEEITNSASE